MKTSEALRSVVARDAGSPDPGNDILEAVPGGPAERVATRWRSRRPVVVGSVLWVLGYIITGIVVVGFGLLLTQLLLHGSLGRWDENVSQWFVTRRTGALDSLTSIGSDLGSTIAIMGVAGVAVAALAIGRHWRQIGFLVYGLTLEFAVFLTATLLVDRPRPNVVRLDPSPVTSSYPSGHTAAAIVLAVGLAVVVSSLVRSRAIRVASWLLAIAIPLAVAFSRLYRGMHHLTDVVASLILGSMVLLFALLTIRTATALSVLREDETDLAVPGRIASSRKLETIP